MFVQRLVRLDRLSEVHVQAVFKLQLEVRNYFPEEKSGPHQMGIRSIRHETIVI